MADEMKLVATDGGELGEEWILSLSRPVVIGRSHTCDVRIHKGTVSGRHLQISRVNGAVQLEVLGQNGATLNGERLEQGDVRPVSVPTL